jgi:cytochrome c peroxidase
MTALFTLGAAGCGELSGDAAPVPNVDDGTGDEHQQVASESLGAFLYKKETFNGNGRMCDTCHTPSSGTLTVEDVQSRASTDPIFRQIDSDGRLGLTYDKLRNDATVTVDITLPPNIKIATDPLATKVTLRRGVPGTKDVAKFDRVLMLDGRAPTLQIQAAGAIAGHAEAQRAPTTEELDSIVMFEKTLFSSDAMKAFAQGVGPAPGLPEGVTESEKRGQAFFAPTGRCGSCHGGTLLNQMTPFNPQGQPPGSQLSSAAVSEANLAGNPWIPFLVTNPATGEVTTVVSPDPGLMLVTGNPAHKNVFKMTSLRNLKKTAPYFHDNSAKTLEAVMVQYKLLFQFLGAPLSDQDIADITAYMYLL